LEEDEAPAHGPLCPAGGVDGETQEEDVTPMEPREVYRHVPDLEWPGWPSVARLLYARLSVPMTTEVVLSWSLCPRFDAGGSTPLQKMGKSRRESFVRNMLSWLTLQGLVDYSGGRWRRTGKNFRT
jgi:hypothetical protein